MRAFLSLWTPALLALVSLFEASNGEPVKAVRFDLGRARRELTDEKRLRRRGSVLQEIDNNVSVAVAEGGVVEV